MGLFIIIYVVGMERIVSESMLKMVLPRSKIHFTELVK